MSDDDEMIPIPGFESYVISKSGIIASLLTGRIMKQTVHVQHNGYKSATVTLRKDDGKLYNCKVARLIAKTFLPNPEDLPTVDHIDRNSLNNSLQNLRWASYQTQNINRDHPFGASGHRHIYKNGNGWQVRIYTYKQAIFCKHFKTIEEAIQARDVFLSIDEPSSTCN